MVAADPREWSRATTLVVVFAVAVGGAFVVAASTSDAAFGAYNPAWDGTADLRATAAGDDVEPRIVRETATYDEFEPSETTAIVISPDRPYTEEEVQRLRAFVENGGRLVVADDFGNHSNDLLADLGADARLDGRLLRDEENHFRAPALPRATNVSNSSTVSGVDQLTLNYATVVQPNGATVLVASSPFGYLDENRNGTLDDDEVLEEYPVVTTEAVGNGTVIVVSDPSVFINSMQEQSDNRAFARRMMENSSTVALDYSHSEQLPPLRFALLELRETPWLQWLLGATLVFGVGLAANRPGAIRRIRRRIAGRLRRRPGPEADADPIDRDALVEYLADRHEDWDRERVERVVESTVREDDRENES